MHSSASSSCVMKMYATPRLLRRRLWISSRPPTKSVPISESGIARTSSRNSVRSVFMPKMRAVQVVQANGPFELVEREIPQPGIGEVRIKVQACGICHSDSLTKEGHWPGIQYPRVPGHEIAGIIDALGSNVAGWSAGQHVGVGWHGGHCGHCDSCRRGDFVTCKIPPQVPGITMDGGYADYMIAPAGALALIPGELSAAEAAPLMCAGITTFNSLRNSGGRAGDVVAVVGIGGLGH